ncbi:hypothetical protein HNY73_018755 [Argiope bruennichi]|uniref:Uncharacterized protein n=1 Tax=Argiope bruennichi TaxID=94029 RepID=A0A8T0EF34_ARGBR|nr:hypothetical protein HNY73_018755 [Argiope bruennichi]
MEKLESSWDMIGNLCVEAGHLPNGLAVLSRAFTAALKYKVLQMKQAARTKMNTANEVCSPHSTVCFRLEQNSLLLSKNWMCLAMPSIDCRTIIEWIKTPEEDMGLDAGESPHLQTTFLLQCARCRRSLTTWSRCAARHTLRTPTSHITEMDITVTTRNQRHNCQHPRRYQVGISAKRNHTRY